MLIYHNKCRHSWRMRQSLLRRSRQWGRPRHRLRPMRAQVHGKVQADWRAVQRLSRPRVARLSLSRRGRRPFAWQGSSVVAAWCAVARMDREAARDQRAGPRGPRDRGHGVGITAQYAQDQKLALGASGGRSGNDIEGGNN